MGRFYKIQPECHDNIITEYMSGVSAIQLAKEYGVDKISIYRILNANNVVLRGSFKYDFSDCIFEEIKNEYIKEISISDLILKYGIPRFAIIKYLRSIDINIRANNVEARKYKINENYFDSIDSNKKAYYLGLLYADGCNTGKNISISLSCKDAYILESLAKDVFITDRPLYIGLLHDKNINHSNTSSLVITNIHISEKLSAIGMVENKSLILEYPKNLDDIYFWHFLRGYFDGDGCVRIVKKKTPSGFNRVSFSIIGTNEFLNVVKQKINALIELEYDIHLYKLKNNKIKELRIISIQDTFKIFNNLYKEADLFLRRKYERFENVYKERGMM
jgi:hypothetical protein